MTTTLHEAFARTGTASHGSRESDARPPVVFLARNLVVGGAERAFLTYVNGAASVQPIVALLALHGGLAHELRPNIRAVDLSLGFPTYGRMADALDRLPGWTGVRLIYECVQLAALLRETRANVVCSFLMRAHLVALLTKRFLSPATRVVLNIHEHWTDSAPFLYPRRRDRWMMRRITRGLFPDADLIVTVATALRDDLALHYGVARERLRVVFNPVEVTRIRAEGQEALSPAQQAFMDVPTFVGVGRLVPLKAFDLLIRAIADLRRTHDARLMLIGDGEERSALAHLTRKLGISDAVLFLGWQANPWKFIARARGLALTSLTEAFPSVISEALALGVPVLATRCSDGIGELLEHGACGLILPPRDVGAITAGLRCLLQDDSTRARLVANGLHRVEDFVTDLSIARYEAVLHQVAGVRLSPGVHEVRSRRE